MQVTQHIERTTGTCSGHPRISGTRIRVSNIVFWVEQGQSPEEIIANYPQLSLADVHSALAYYFDNREEIDKLIQEDEQFVKAAESRQNGQRG